MAANDPCGPQPPDSVCSPMKGHIAYAMCDPTGKWVKDATGRVKCDCMTCGNGIVEPQYGEQCEMAPMPTGQPNMISASCQTLTGNPRSMGTISCDASCQFVMSCMNAPNMPIGGSGGGGTGG